MTIWDPEGAQRTVYEAGGFNPNEAVGCYDLAEGLIGRGCIEYIPRIADGKAGVYSPFGRRERIVLRNGLTEHRECWTIFHEISERHYYGERGDERHDDACDQLAARLRAPRGAFRALVSAIGRKLRPLALESGQSQTSTMIRVGEVFGDPVVVVTPQTVHVAGDVWGWPDEHELRRLTTARKLPPEIRRVKITDAARRYAFVAVAT